MSTSQTSDQLLLKANPKLSAADIQTYNVKKAQLFKLTIAICAIYGAISLIILMITIYTSTGNILFTQEIRPFTITFIGGMIFVIIFLIIQIISFKPIALTVSSYDSDICPDFWKLVPTVTSGANIDPIYKTADAATQGLLQYQCKPNQTVYNTYSPAATGSSVNPYGQNIGKDASGNPYAFSTVNLPANTLPTDPNYKLVGANGTNGAVTSLTSGTYGTNNLRCDQIFPNLLANRNANDTDIQGTPNALACAYAKQCGIPWANVCGN
jgi:hypothetical protein